MKTKLLLLILLTIIINVNAQIGFQDHEIVSLANESTDRAYVVFASDIDNDGDLDVLSASEDDNKVVWYENLDGLGTFGAQHTISDKALTVRAIYTSDIDGDGDMDVLSASLSDNKIAWYENMDSQGTFGNEKIITTSAGGARSVYAGDIDGDGDIDVVSASYDDNTIAWYENTDGLGNFITKQEKHVEGANSVIVFDMDKDGDMDILFGTESYAFADKIAWYENIDGLGNFSLEHSVISNTNNIYNMNIGDIDNDGDIDVLSASTDGNKLRWYENTNGLGAFGGEKVISNSFRAPRSIFASDVDGDGDMDILSASYDNSYPVEWQNEYIVAWFENTDGLGSFAPPNIISTEQKGPHSVFGADLDNDGDIDVLTAFKEKDYVAWYKNTDGLGNFGTSLPITKDINGPTSIITNDIDNDGDLDVISTSEDGKVAWYQNTNGLGNFSAQKIITADAIGANSVCAADIDKDGDLDVIATSEDGHYVAWYENLDGLGSFGSRQLLGPYQTNYPRSIYATDINNDGNIDVVAAASDFIYWYDNNDGLGTFNNRKEVLKIAQRTLGASFVFASDIDNDGDMDVLSASEDDNKIAWFKNKDGLGNFEGQRIITLDASRPKAVLTSDIDGDGDMDVISASAGDNKIAWYENIDGLGSFGVQQIVKLADQGGVSSSYARTVHAGDIDNDGDMDILSCSYNGNKISWHENLGLTKNEIKGFINVDNDSNGCDFNDPTVPNLMVSSCNGTNIISAFTQKNGFYQVFPETGDYNTAINSVPSYYTINPDFYNSKFLNIGNTDTANFCLEPNQTIHDLNISLLPITEARPGFDATYQLVYHNVGTTQLNGSIVLVFDNSKLSFLTASETIASQTINSITINYGILNPFETRTINLNFNVKAPPTTNIGDILNFIATINPVSGDNTKNDNVFQLNQTVIGSYDPNDIAVLEGSQILLKNADEYLHYIIRFQNTGTADAINIKVTNIIDPNLDWTTIQLESLSHNGRVEIQDGSKISFIFNGIYLPDSTNDEQNSHGFIAYKIKPKSGIDVGDIMFNKADIFFDFNLAIETNVVSTEIANILGADDRNLFKAFIYPNPSNEIIYIKSKSEIKNIEILNLLGQNTGAISNQKEINISHLSNGIYTVKIVDTNENFIIKKLIKK